MDSANDEVVSLPRAWTLSLGSTMVLVLGLVKFLSPHFEDPDFYWHIKAGEYLLSTWPPGRADVFSYPNAGHPWVLAEWGGQVLLYLVFHAFGYTGIAWFVALLCATVLSMVYRCCEVLGCSDVRAAVMTLLCGFVLLGDPPRPHLFTLLLLSFTLNLLLGFKYRDKVGYLWLLPVAMALWANLHGGYFIGLVLIAVFLLSEWVLYGLHEPDAVKKQKLTRLTIWAMGAAVATLLSPESISYWWYPIKAVFLLGDLSGDAQAINEWQSPDFHVLINQFFLGLVACFIAVLIYSRKKADLTEVTVPMLFTIANFIAVRNLSLAVIVMMPFLGKFSAIVALPDSKGALAQSLRKLSRQLTAEQQQSGAWGGLVNIMLVVIVGITVFLIYPQHQKKIEALVEMYMPVKATNFLLREHIQGNMFNAYQYGGYLVFRLYPAQKVFIYGRTDVFRQGFLREYSEIYQGKMGWKKYFDLYHIDYVLCDSDAAIRQLLLTSGTFKRVYEDRFHSVLVRNEPQFYGLIVRYGR